MAHNYVLRVTAGPSYDPSTHHLVSVNQPTPLKFSSEHADVSLNVRIQNYRGLPKSSPSTSPYFSHPPHTSDQYSIAFTFNLRNPVSSSHLAFGNDFDHPIRDRLPPGFSTAMRIVKWTIDPGLDGDVYADKPYLYGPLGSSVNLLGEAEVGDAGIEVEEGGEWREESGCPESAAQRRKWFLNGGKESIWQAGKEYAGDFFNGYLDFNEFALRLPGFTLPIMKYWDGQSLRYVLKNKETGDVIFVVCFTLFLKEDVDEEGNIKEGVEGGKIGYGVDGVEGVGDGIEGDKKDEKEDEKKKSEEKRTINTDDDDVD